MGNPNQEGFEVGFFGQRFARASDSERRRRSRSAALNFFGTPLAMRPRAAAILDGSGIARVGCCKSRAEALDRRIELDDIGLRAQLKILSAAPHAILIQLPSVRNDLHRLPSDVDRRPNRRKLADPSPSSVLKQAHLTRPFCVVSHLVVSNMTVNRFPVNMETATIFQGCLPNAEAQGRPPLGEDVP